MTSSLLPTPTLDDHLLRLLAVVTPDQVRSGYDARTADVTLHVDGKSRSITRQVWHLHDLGLVERDGIAWSRTEAGDTYLTQHGGAR